MPAIKRMATGSTGNISVTRLDGTVYSATRTNLLKLTEDALIGAAIKTNLGFDVYVHCYTSTTNVNTKRTAVMICDKGIVPSKNWWVYEEVNR